MDTATVSRLLLDCCRMEVAQRGRRLLDEAVVADCCRQMAEVLTLAEGTASGLEGAQPKPSARHFGCILTGRVGSGKTTLMLALQRLLATMGRVGMLPFGTGLRVVSAKDIHATEAQRDRFTLLCQDELLGIDDLGTESKEELSYGTVTTPLTDLIEYRYRHQLFTVITTNLTPKERMETYGARFADRTREMCRQIVFAHASYR